MHLKFLALLVLPSRGLAAIAKIPEIPSRDLSSSLAPRAISPDGSCGGAVGYTCPTGNCCSQFGYWYEIACHVAICSIHSSFPYANPRRFISNSGSSDAFCGNGCQASFGSCGIQPPPPPDGSCGGANSVKCGDGLCCSQYGYWYAFLPISLVNRNRSVFLEAAVYPVCFTKLKFYFLWLILSYTGRCLLTVILSLL